MDELMKYTHKHSPELVKSLCKSLELGMMISDACKVNGISRKTFYEWKQSDSDIVNAIKKSRSKFIENNLKIIQDAAPKYWAAAAWMLERVKPEQFALAGRLNVSGQVDQNIKITLSSEYLHTKKLETKEKVVEGELVGE